MNPTSQTTEASGTHKPVQVLVKAIAILDCLAEEPELSVARLSELIEEPRGTVYRLLATLSSTGLVEPGSGRGSYRLGLRLFKLGNAVAARFDARRLALPVMERIHDDTGETVFLCVRREDEAVCIERLDGRRVASLALQIGGSLPLHVGAAPRVLLAWAPEDEVDDYLGHGSFEAFTDSTPVTAASIRRALEDIRSRGYAISDEDVTIGIAALGAPIFDHTGAVVAALSISGARPAILGDSAAGLPERLVAGADEVSRELGFEGRPS